MIFQTDYWSYARIFFEWVANSAGVMVFITGFIALTWLGYERKRRGSFTKRKVEKQSGFDLSKFLRILSYAGVIVGILDIWAGTTGLIQDIPPSFRYRDLTANEADHFTCIFLIVVGIAMLFKPVNDLPLASILGLLAGTATAVVLAILIPDNVVELIGSLINPKLLLIIIFIIVAVIVALTAKFYIGVLQAISKFLSWPPIALIIMVFSFVQGILLWGLGTSIFVNLL
ncbi:MAG: hypothetical protein EU516_01925 [Promethearchaeota archaeon]|nr:MAG: hypothetical protein EU516_01925 [Candidatus Lokiarchaeota archaeon]